MKLKNYQWWIEEGIVSSALWHMSAKWMLQIFKLISVNCITKMFEEKKILYKNEKQNIIIILIFKQISKSCSALRS